MRITFPITEYSLSVLPWRFAVAFAARCARRVQPLFASRFRGASEDALRTMTGAVENAIGLAEKAALGDVCFTTLTHRYALIAGDEAGDDRAAGAAGAAAMAARAADGSRGAISPISVVISLGTGDDKPPGEVGESLAAATLARKLGDSQRARAGIASDVHSAYASSVRAAGDDAPLLVAAALCDYLKLLNRAADDSIDPTEKGPLGILWPSEAPDWYRGSPGGNGRPKAATVPLGDLSRECLQLPANLRRVADLARADACGLLRSSVRELREAREQTDAFFASLSDLVLQVHALDRANAAGLERVLDDLRTLRKEFGASWPVCDQEEARLAREAIGRGGGVELADAFARIAGTDTETWLRKVEEHKRKYPRPESNRE